MKVLLTCVKSFYNEATTVIVIRENNRRNTFLKHISPIIFTIKCFHFLLKLK